MPEPTGSDLHIDTFLSNLSIGYMNEPSAYIADQVFPVVYTDKQSDKYAIYNKYDWFRDEAKDRAPLTESAGGGWGMETPGTFFCGEKAYHSDIADEDEDNADEVFNLQDDATSFVTDKLKLNRERRWAESYFTTDVWTTDLTGTSNTPDATGEFLAWDVSGSTPITDIEGAKAIIKGLTGLGVGGMTMVVAERVHQVLKNHGDILDRFKYTQAGIITEQLLARVFEVKRYLVAGAVYSPLPEGTNTLSWILNQAGVLLVYSAPRPSRRLPSGGYTFRWRRPMVRGVSGDRLETTIRKIPLKLKRGTRIEGGVYEDIKLVAADCGVFFNNAALFGETVTS